MLGVMLMRDNSRLNATKHGCCAKTLILPDECQEDFDWISNGWRAEFAPEGYQEERLVEIVILNDWLLQRAQRRLWEAEAVLCAGPDQPLDDEQQEMWEAQKQHDLELKQRYKTSCERAFFRAWAALQGLRKDLERRDLALAHLEAKIQKLKAEREALEKELGVKSEPESGGDADDNIVCIAKRANIGPLSFSIPLRRSRSRPGALALSSSTVGRFTRPDWGR